MLKKAPPCWTTGTNRPPTPLWAGSRRRGRCRRPWLLCESFSVEWPRDTHRYVSVRTLKPSRGRKFSFNLVSWCCNITTHFALFRCEKKEIGLNIWIFPFFFKFSSQTDYRGDDSWHRDQLGAQVESQLRVELEESHKQLKCAHDTQQEQRNKMQSLRCTTHTE